MRAMQSSLFGDWPLISSVLVLTATALAGTLAAARWFRWE